MSFPTGCQFWLNPSFCNEPVTRVVTFTYGDSLSIAVCSAHAEQLAPRTARNAQLEPPAGLSVSPREAKAE